MRRETGKAARTQADIDGTRAGPIGLSRRTVRAAFPGHRAAWLGAAAVCVIASLFGGRFLLAKTASLTGTNSVGVGTVIANAAPRQEVCVRDLDVPRGTGRLGVSMVALQTAPGARLRAYLSADGVRVPLAQTAQLGSLSFLEFVLPTTLDEGVEDTVLCVTPFRMTVGFGGAFSQRPPTSPVTTVAGEALVPGDISVRYLRPRGPSPRVLDALPDALRRAAVFESRPGTVLVWLALPTLLLLVYVTVYVSATANGQTMRRLALTAAAVALAHSMAWAVLLHPFHGADESEHFAYAQFLAATNQRADAGFTRRPPYSTSQLRLLESLHHNSTILNPSSRPRWQTLYAEEYSKVKGKSLREDDGGGFTTGASGHSPLYYAIVGIPYRALHPEADLPSLLLAMRLLSALMAAAVAALAVLTAGLAFGGQRSAAWLSGVLVALQPVFGSVAGAVNNDTAVNLAAASLVFCLVRAWRCGPTPMNASLIGVLVVALPIAKITGFALWPLVLIAAVVIGIYHGHKRAIHWTTMIVGSALVTGALWSFALAPAIGGTRGTLVNQHPLAPSAVGAPPANAQVSLRTRGNYLLQTIVPSPTVGTNHWNLQGAGPLERWPAYAIYIKRGYGLFGWKSVELSVDLLRGVALWLAVGWALCIAAIVRHRRSWRRWLGGALILASAVPLVIAFVSYAFATMGVQNDFGEQGRYLFTAMVPLAVMFSAASLAFKGNLRHASLGAMTSAASCLAVIAWASALRGWFT